MKVYVNLHPKYDYSNVTINEGYIAELKEYVKNVEWLEWDYVSVKGKPFIRVSGENHIERTKVLLQRLMKKGVTVYVRNERGEEWSVYEPQKEFSNTEMVQIEQQKYKPQYDLEWAEKDLEKMEKMIEFGVKKGIAPEPELLQWRDEVIERIKKIEADERQRLDSVAKAWT